MHIAMYTSLFTRMINSIDIKIYIQKNNKLKKQKPFSFDS